MNRPLTQILSDPGFWVIFGIMFFLGLTLGWFFRKGSIIMIFIGMMIFAPFLDALIRADNWIYTVPYVLGFLIHTAKPLWRRLTR